MTYRLPQAMPRVSYSLDTLRGDIFGGITSAVVGLPIALAFGVASGLGAAAGLYGAIAVGFFAAVFGGTRSQISGPTAPTSVAMAVIFTVHADGDLSKALAIAMMAGVIQILLGALRIGRFISYTPYSVTSGFMSGIGIIIIIIQTLPFLGWAVPTGGPLKAMRSWPEVLGDVNFEAFGIALATLLVGIFWPRQLRRFLPPTLAALVVGTVIGVIWLSNTPVIGDIGAVPRGLPDFALPAFDAGFLASTVQPAITLALLGAIDSLLTSLIADSMTRTQHNPNKELVGQGIGNVAAALSGGLAGAGATPGTVVNLRAGGSTPVSGVLRAVILLVLVLGLGPLAEEIPQAVLAGILMKVGWDIIDWRFLTRLLRVQPEHLLVMLITLAMTVFLDLVSAVAIGLIAAGMASARQFERLQLDSVVSVPLLDRSFFTGHESAHDIDAFSARVGLVALRGSFTVASSTKLISTITVDIRDHEVVILDFSETVYIDDSAALVVEQLVDTAISEDTEVIVMGLTGAARRPMDALNVLDRVPEDRFAANLDEAREIARGLLEL
ncbi:MAG: SulP family inorganic anion transporter [Dehalococcoidia bacterium]|nr:SulP family inorganic anion transporter [Dehalococcoidia bacterium]MYA52905.1 SulP family inorganic anion transporter [Dehalococcoidia bacterium]